MTANTSTHIFAVQMAGTWVWIRNAFKVVIVLSFSLCEVCATDPKPTVTSSDLHDVVVNTLATVLDTATGSPIEKSKGADQELLPLQEILTNTKEGLGEKFNSMLSDKNITNSESYASREMLSENLPDFSQLTNDTDPNNGWNWEKFAQEVLPSFSTADSTSYDAGEYHNPPPECGMDVPEMIRHAGYKVETHSTETTDGYILEIFRIPFGRHGSWQFRDGKRPAVFFMHGILTDSSCWVVNGPDRSLPYILANAGCDVWLGNVRGSTYSRKHKTLNPDTDEKFWRFTWQDMSQYDVPAMIDKILSESGQQSLYYVGHSQGTLIAFAKLAEDMSFNHKIRMMFALGPVSTLGNITSPVRALVSLAPLARFGLSLFGGTEILPKKAMYQWISAQLHKLNQTSFNDAMEYHGNNLFLNFGGCHINHYFKDRLPVYLSHTPAGTSFHNLLHMGQMVLSGKMEKFDHLSEAENKKMYGQATPPEFDVRNIQSPVVLFVGSKDQLADPVDSELLSKKLKHLFHYKVMEEWDHLDFLWGKEAIKTVYADVLAFITETESSLHGSVSGRLNSQSHVDL